MHLKAYQTPKHCTTVYNTQRLDFTTLESYHQSFIRTVVKYTVQVTREATRKPCRMMYSCVAAHSISSLYYPAFFCLFVCFFVAGSPALASSLHHQTGTIQMNERAAFFHSLACLSGADLMHFAPNTCSVFNKPAQQAGVTVSVFTRCSSLLIVQITGGHVIHSTEVDDVIFWIY